MNIVKTNDYELLYLIHRKNRIAHDVLINKYRYFILMKIKHFSNEKNIYDDIVQDCLFELSKAIYTYDESFNVLFSTYIGVIIQRKLVKIFNIYYREKETIYLLQNKMNLDMLEEKNTVFDNIVIEIDEKRIYKELKIRLNDFQWMVFERIMLQKDSILDISREYNCSSKKIYNTIQSIKNIYKKIPI